MGPSDIRIIHGEKDGSGHAVTESIAVHSSTGLSAPFTEINRDRVLSDLRYYGVELDRALGTSGMDYFTDSGEFRFFPQNVMAHYDAIMTPGLTNEAVAEGLAALNLCNTAGSMREGQRKLAEWYVRYSPETLL
jgi:hypothetical protein